MESKQDSLKIGSLLQTLGKIPESLFTDVFAESFCSEQEKKSFLEHLKSIEEVATRYSDIKNEKKKRGKESITRLDIFKAFLFRVRKSLGEDGREQVDLLRFVEHATIKSILETNDTDKLVEMGESFLQVVAHLEKAQLITHFRIGAICSRIIQIHQGNKWTDEQVGAFFVEKLKKQLQWAKRHAKFFVFIRKFPALLNVQSISFSEILLHLVDLNKLANTDPSVYALLAQQSRVVPFPYVQVKPLEEQTPATLTKAEEDTLTKRERIGNIFILFFYF